MSTNTGYRHFRVIQHGKPATKGGVTMAFKSPRHLQDLTRDDTVEIAFSFCSAQDVFCRQTGRQVADARMAHALSVPGDEFLQIVRQEDPSMIVHQMAGLDWDQHKALATRLSKVYG